MGMLTKFCVNPGQQVIRERENAIIDRFCSEVLRHFQEEINECINIASLHGVPGSSLMRALKILEVWVKVMADIGCGCGAGGCQEARKLAQFDGVDGSGLGH